MFKRFVLAAMKVAMWLVLGLLGHFLFALVPAELVVAVHSLIYQVTLEFMGAIEALSVAVLPQKS